MDTVGSVQLAMLVGALGTLGAVLLQVAGRWPGGRPAFGPFQSVVLAVSLVGVSLASAAVLEARPREAGAAGLGPLATPGAKRGKHRQPETEVSGCGAALCSFGDAF